MRIEFVEIANFRKLESVRIELSNETTVFVGANNSGKTSAILALRYFLLGQRNRSRERIQFTMYDISMCHWRKLIELGKIWEKTGIVSDQAKIESESSNNNSKEGESEDVEQIKEVEAQKSESDDKAIDSANQFEDLWNSILPHLDVWLHVEKSEAYLVQSIIPTLDWDGGLLGVRIRLELKDNENLKKDYLDLRKMIYEVIKSNISKTDKEKKQYKLLWPINLCEFLQRRFRKYFDIKAYILNPDKLNTPVYGEANPQKLNLDSIPIDGDPFKGLIQIDEISAQRGFGQNEGVRDFDDRGNTSGTSTSRKMADQLRQYWKRHLDPVENPSHKDMEALKVVGEAQREFDERLKEGFEDAIKEVEGMGYPGVTDPKLKIATRLRLTDGLNHDSAVQYGNETNDTKEDFELNLPETSNGLGYQNLISMIFKLMSFRDEWMRIAKDHDDKIPRLHLVLVEEPEAYLHVQVQQVFIRKAYEVLRNSTIIKSNPNIFNTQLVVSTHSSHVALECDFMDLRYFRRLPMDERKVPISRVINLKAVFENEKDTKEFVRRFIKITHCDLLFADAAIFVEGATERMLVPDFIDTCDEFIDLRHCYITLIEVGGSHLHKFRELIEHLGLTTLIITDLDSNDNSGNKVVPERGKSLTTRNHTLSKWYPGENDLDTLLDLCDEKKIKRDDEQRFSIRVAYQCPVKIKFKLDEDDALSKTFESALVLENFELITSKSNPGMWKKFKSAIEEKNTIKELNGAVDNALDSGKVEFALYLLELDETDKVKPPKYIMDGLMWLMKELKNRNEGLGVSAGSSENVEEGDNES